MTQLSTAMVRTYQTPLPARQFTVKACNTCAFYRLLAQQLCSKTGGVCDGKGCAGHSAASLPTLSKRSSKARKWGEV
jgi:sulfur relay (sulfurtransferase) complex TusBCD TusD component (DsrE family)